jgi:hypothetical protein
MGIDKWLGMFGLCLKPRIFDGFRGLVVFSGEWLKRGEQWEVAEFFKQRVRFECDRGPPVQKRKNITYRIGAAQCGMWILYLTGWFVESFHFRFGRLGSRQERRLPGAPAAIPGQLQGRSPQWPVCRVL